MIRVASYNMRKAIGTDRRRRPERTIEVLNELGADVVALQEADRRFGSRASAVPLHMIEEHSDYVPVPLETRAGSIGWHGNALLVRKGVEVLERHLFHLPSLEPRGAVLAEVRVGGVALRVVGMHLDLSGLWRRRQAHAILAHLGERDGALPTVLMGDLNEWSSGGGCLRDFAAHHHFAPCGRSFHARRPIAQLDRIMVSHDLEIVDSGAHHSPTARRASDHLPVWAELRASGEPQPLPPSFSGRAAGSGWASRLRSSIASQSRKGRR
jgi:endonuclease/exonuclease/phosphatase family metal-dependent hydrolase